MQASELLSEEKNNRDKKEYRTTFNNLIQRLGNIFKPPITSEEQLDQDIDCLSLVEKILPELTVKNVELFANMLQKDLGCVFEDPIMNGILRSFHRVRYVA